MKRACVFAVYLQSNFRVFNSSRSVVDDLKPKDKKIQYRFYFIFQKELSMQEKDEFDCVTGREGTEGNRRIIQTILNPLKTKRSLPYLKTQVVPRSKHFSSRL
jgi:hypothetical protein